MWPRKRRTVQRSTALLRRRIDGSLWVAWHPQNIGIAMSCLFTDDAGYHFIKARWRNGKLVASPRIFWRPRRASMFEVVRIKQTCDLMPAWPQDVEDAKIYAPRSLAPLVT